MPDAQPLRISDLSGGMNDTKDPILLADNELSRCRNKIWRNGRLETRRGYTLEKHVKFDAQLDITSHTATTITKTGWAVSDDEYNGYIIEVYGGTAADQTQTIVDTEANGGNGRITVVSWSPTPEDGISDFRIYAPIKKLYRYVRQTGAEILIAHTGGHIFKSTDGQTWTQVAITDNDSAEIIFTKAAQMSFVTYQGKVFGFNGTENVWSYDGTNTFVYDRGKESDATADVANNTTLEDSTTIGDGADFYKNFWIYFLSASTTNFDLNREVTGFATATGTYTFAAVEANTVDNEKYYVGPNIPKAAYAAVCQNRIFGLMRSDDNCHFCAVDDYWYWPSINYFVTEVGEGQRNTGIVDYLGKLVVFKERSTIRYEVSSSFPENWSHQVVSANIGCAHNDSIQILPIEGIDHLVWLSYEGFCIMGPDWQVRNISKDKLDVLFNDLQIPIYNYLEKVWTLTADFPAGGESPATSIDQSGDEFTPALGTALWDTDGAGATGFEQGTGETGYSMVGIKSANDYLEIDFTESEQEKNPTGDEWVWIDSLPTEPWPFEKPNQWQSFSHDGGMFVSKIDVYVKLFPGHSSTQLQLDLAYASTKIASATATCTSLTGEWLTFTFNQELVRDGRAYTIYLSKSGSGTDDAYWRHSASSNPYANGYSSEHPTQLGDFLFNVFGYPASGVWTSNSEDMTWVTPEYGDFSVAETATEGTHTVTYEMANLAADTGWSSATWYEIHEGEHIYIGLVKRYCKIRVTLTTDTYNDSPQVDDVSVPYCGSATSIFCDAYEQTTGFDEWGTLEATFDIPVAPDGRTATVRWYYRTGTGAPSGSWIDIQPGDKIPEPSSDTFVQWKCLMGVLNASYRPTIQDVSINWLDWTAGGTLTAIISSGVWDDTYWFLGAERDSSTNNIAIVIDKRGSLWPMDIAMNTIAKFKNQLYGGDTDGKVYYMDVGYSDNDVAYLPYAETKEFGSPELEYLHNAFDVVLEAMGTYDLTVGYVIDPTLGTSGALTYTTLAAVDLSGAGTLPKRVRFDSTNNLVGHFIRFKFSTAAVNNPFFLYGFSVWRAAFGLRGDPDPETARVALDPARHIT